MFTPGEEVWVRGRVVEHASISRVKVHVADQPDPWPFHVDDVQGSAKFHVSRNHPQTSKQVEPKIREGSLQARLLAMFDYDVEDSYGWTDDELEMATQRSHQSVSAVRNILVSKGLVENSGLTRKTRFGNDAIVWQRTALRPV